MKKLKWNRTLGDFIVKCIIYFLVSIVTLGLGSIWAYYDAIKWIIEGIEIEG